MSFQKLINPTVARCYLVCVVAWKVLQSFSGDGHWWLYPFNIMADYLMLLIPPMAFMALKSFRRARWATAGLSLTIVTTLIGNLRPPAPAVAKASPALRVLTYNLLSTNTDSRPVIADLHRADADVVCLQEMSSPIAAGLAAELAADYPYQLLDVQKLDVRGMGVLSRYPLRSTDAALDGAWVGHPQIVSIDWNGTQITLVNSHAIHALAGVPWVIDRLNAGRLQAARALAAFVRAQTDPIIICGDFNSTPSNSVYGVLSATLIDSWREAGTGPGYSWNLLAGWPGLFRIDYVWHTAQLRATQTSVEPSSGFSDHHPVLARLVVRQPAG